MRNDMSKRKTTHLEKEKKKCLSCLQKILSSERSAKTQEGESGRTCGLSREDIAEMHSGRKASRRSSRTGKQRRSVASSVYRIARHLHPGCGHLKA